VKKLKNISGDSRKEGKRIVVRRDGKMT